MEDANGKPVSGLLAEERPVQVNIGYELKPSPYHPLKVEIIGPDLWGLGQTRDRLELDNGVVLTGRTYGGGFDGKSGQVRKMRLVDIEESKIELHSTNAASLSPEVDAIILGVLSTHPLGYGACVNGVARPGFPFSYRTSYPNELKARWSTTALRLHHDRLEITLVGTTNYWRKFVEVGVLQHDAIVGVRRLDGGVLEWDEVNRVALLLSNFLGWINHCASPVFHIKGYRKGQVVYRGYDLYPHPTVRRDLLSWLPMSFPNDLHGAPDDLLQGLLDGFAKAWARNEEESGIFYIALDMLRSRSKGAPRHRAAIGYLRDTFSACSILVSILIGSGGKRSRRDVIWRCLKNIGVDDELPLENRVDREWVMQNHPDLWWGETKGMILEYDKGTLSRPLANVENWLLHLDDPKNVRMLLGLPISVQQYLVEVSTWLADLMVLKVVGYRGWYLNRLTGKTEVVPWVK